MPVTTRENNGDIGKNYLTRSVGHATVPLSLILPVCIYLSPIDTYPNPVHALAFFLPAYEIAFIFPGFRA